MNERPETTHVTPSPTVEETISASNPQQEGTPSYWSDTTCPMCYQAEKFVEMIPEHGHYMCPRCGWRDSCCF
jgi:hypothetical protein